jgi:hypothetical protein
MDKLIKNLEDFNDNASKLFQDYEEWWRILKNQTSEAVTNINKTTTDAIQKINDLIENNADIDNLIAKYEVKFNDTLKNYKDQFTILSNNFNDKIKTCENEKTKLVNEYNTQLDKIKQDYESQFSSLSNAFKNRIANCDTEKDNLIKEFNTELSKIKQDYEKQLVTLFNTYNDRLKECDAEKNNLINIKNDLIEEKNNLINEFNAKLDEMKKNFVLFDYIQDKDPTENVNPSKKYALWFNTKTNTIWICTDNTTDKNTWLNITQGKGSISFGKVYILGDGSCMAYFPLTKDINDLGGKQTGYIDNSSGSTYPSFSSDGAYFENDRYGYGIDPGVDVGEAYTISFQGKAAGSQLDADDQYMFTPKGAGSWSTAIFRPGWNKNYTYLEDSSIDLLINDDKWHTYTIVCGGEKDKTQLYIDGQLFATATQRYKNTTIASIAGGDVNGFNSDAYDGWAGYMKNLRFFNRALTEDEINIIIKE